MGLMGAGFHALKNPSAAYDSRAVLTLTDRSLERHAALSLPRRPFMPD